MLLGTCWRSRAVRLPTLFLPLPTLSWSAMAEFLMASRTGDGKVSLWKESIKGAWEEVSELSS